MTRGSGAVSGSGIKWDHSSFTPVVKMCRLWLEGAWANLVATAVLLSFAKGASAQDPLWD